MLDSVQQGDISGIEEARRQGANIFSTSSGKSMLHLAAMCRGPSGAETVRWLLEKGVPWNAADRSDQLAEHLATTYGNVESAKVLREWAIREGSLASLMKLFHYLPKKKKDYEMYYKPYDLKKEWILEHFRLQTAGRLDRRQNEWFCSSPIAFKTPDRAPDDEVAMVTVPNGCGIMMEWERPISESYFQHSFFYYPITSVIVKETARLLLDGMPTKGLRILNIGFGIGMVCER